MLLFFIVDIFRKHVAPDTIQIRIHPMYPNLCCIFLKMDSKKKWGAFLPQVLVANRPTHFI